jgi:hypothetical protein
MHEESSKVDITTALTVIANCCSWNMYSTEALVKLYTTASVKASKALTFI